MHYVISDIHGGFDSFLRMLEKIKFDPQKDTLYILGDAIDRGPRSIDLLQYLISNSNITLIRGNHEDMMLNALVDSEYVLLWYGNGGSSTNEQYLNLSIDERLKIFKYLSETPLYFKLSLGGKNYVLVHGYYPPGGSKDSEDYTWERMPLNETYLDYTVIFGHTSTKHYQRTSEFPLIYFDATKIGMDCSLMTSQKGVLGCLRLEDYKTFYVTAEKPDHQARLLPRWVLDQMPENLSKQGLNNHVPFQTILQHYRNHGIDALSFMLKCNLCGSVLNSFSSEKNRNCDCKTSGINHHGPICQVVCLPEKHDFTVTFLPSGVTFTFVNGAYVLNHHFEDILARLQKWSEDKPISLLELFGDYVTDEVDILSEILLHIELAEDHFSLRRAQLQLTNLLGIHVRLYNHASIDAYYDVTCAYNKGHVVIKCK